ncbi:MAG: MFS transporter [Reichenbachiella sp.]|uniref:MFS transporter n=1 Tax=Reichenbachiella sp. TaxID=2184521 RepID=UPI00329956E6
MHKNQPFRSINFQRLFTLFLLILAGESIFFLPFVLARVFRPTLLAVFEITNLELGALFSVYGVVAMISYFFGGPLADRFPSKTLLTTALTTTGLGGIALNFTTSYSGLSWLYAFWGLTTILLFWAALLKTTRILGGQDFQARAFGLLEGGRGLIAAFVGSIAVGILAFYLPADDLPTLAEQQFAFRQVVFFFSGWVILVGTLIAIFLKNSSSNSNQTTKRITWREFKLVIGKSVIWYQAVIIICAYTGYKVTDDFSLLASDVLGFSDVASAQVGAMALWMRMITAIAAGFLADRIGQSSKVISWGFGIMIVSGVVIGSGLLPNQPTFFYLLSITTTCLGVYAVRGLYFSLVQEAHIPIVISGTAIGLISVIGFTPDIFMGPLMGYLLDQNPGALGHQLVFLVLAGFAFIGLLATHQFKKANH